MQLECRFCIFIGSVFSVNYQPSHTDSLLCYIIIFAYFTLLLCSLCYRDTELTKHEEIKIPNARVLWWGGQCTVKDSSVRQHQPNEEENVQQDYTHKRTASWMPFHIIISDNFVINTSCVCVRARCTSRPLSVHLTIMHLPRNADYVHRFICVTLYATLLLQLACRWTQLRHQGFCLKAKR